MKTLNYLSVLLILSLLFGCSQPRVKIDNLEERLDRYVENASLILDLEGNPISGVAFQTYDDGTIFIELSVRRGIPHGQLKRYYENGRLAEMRTYKNGHYRGEITWVNGLLEGPYVKYYNNGQLKWKINHKNGELDGPYEWYFENGQLETKGTYRNGERNGTFERYYENGQLNRKGRFENGRFISD